MALENGIRKYLPLVEIELFSPGESSKGYGNDNVIHSYEEFDLIHEQRHFDAIVLGGGELLHNRDIAFEDNRIIYRGGQCGSSP